MGIINSLISFIYEREPIKHSNSTNIITKFGMFQIKVYKDSQYEYLTIMSRNFSTLDTPIVYIHSDFHITDPNEQEKQISMALQMIYKEGGVVIYPVEEGKAVDELLEKINGRKLQSCESDMTETKSKLGLKTFGRIYHTLGFILKDLNLSKIVMITTHGKDVEIAQQLGIEVVKQVSSISFGYGE